jgi:cytochrome c oxidase assembly protein subunit 11
MALFGDNPVAATVAKMAAVVVIMFSFVFVVMVPLYDVLCDALGINGKTSGQRYEAATIQVDESREITIQFIATNSDGMPWEFRPSETIMRVHPGALNATVFFARNPLPRDMVAQAIPSVSPARAAEYFHKTECFCFNNQPLGGEQSTEMPLQFIVDQDLPRDIKTITLSYTMFDITEMASAAVASR